LGCQAAEVSEEGSAFFSKKKVLLGSFRKEDVAIQLSRATNSAALDCFVGDASSQ